MDSTFPKKARLALAMFFSIETFGDRFGDHHVSRHLLVVEGFKEKGGLFTSGCEFETLEMRSSHFDVFNFRKLESTNWTMTSACACKASVVEVILRRSSACPMVPV